MALVVATEKNKHKKPNRKRRKINSGAAAAQLKKTNNDSRADQLNANKDIAMQYGDTTTD